MPRLNLPNQIIEYSMEGSGPLVIFIQGVGVAGSGWKPQLSALADQFTVVSFDNRGIGLSAAESRNFSVRDLAADVVKIMDSLGSKDAHLVGHSMGGLIAQEVALSCPERVKSLALICTFFQGRQAVRFSPKLIWLGSKSRIGSPRSRRWAMLRMILSKKCYDSVDLDEAADQYGKLMGRDLASNPPVILKQLKAMSKYVVNEELRSRLSVPTVVVSGSEDPISLPRFGRQIADQIPNAKYIKIDGASHAVTIEDAEQINQILRTHLASVKRD